MRTLIFIPTYKKAQDACAIYDQIKALNLDADILFCDDKSSDDTGKVIDKIVSLDPKVFVIHQEKKLGASTAHLQGIDWAYAKGYHRLITINCDFLHAPLYIKKFIELSNDGDVVIASRYIGHFITNALLKMPYNATETFRLYNLENIPQGVFHLPRLEEYSFFFESLYVLMLNGFKIKEFPLSLPVQTCGNSKIPLQRAYKNLLLSMTLCTLTLFKRHEFIYSNVPLTKQFEATNQAYAEQGQLSAAQVEEDWNAYWKSDRKSIHVVYDAIACFYRYCIIKSGLNHFIRKYLPPNSIVLHAGCGSGQVDVDISKEYRMYALDITSAALSIYKKYNPKVCKLLWADIFHLPLKDNEIDGVYNLGVMEHFTEEEIQLILLEFHRVLKPQGKAIIFWPAKFGVTVRFLAVVHYLLNNILRMNVKLHPDEITHIKSKEHMSAIFEKANFKVREYYFGSKDLWTQAVMVAEK